MHIGMQLVAIGSNPLTYYTPWFPKGADNAYFTYELIHSSFGSGGGMTVVAYTKNREDIGSQGPVSSVSFSAIGSTGLYEAPCENLRDLVRFKITITPGDETAYPQGVVYRFLPPTWYDKAV